jgi:hypothetical protein
VQRVDVVDVMEVQQVELHLTNVSAFTQKRMRCWNVEGREEVQKEPSFTATHVHAYDVRSKSSKLVSERSSTN